MIRCFCALSFPHLTEPPCSLNSPSTSSSPGSLCRKAVVVWARSRVERPEKIACGHRDNKGRAWGLTLQDYYLIQGDSWIRAAWMLALLLSVSKAIILRHLRNIRMLKRSNISIPAQYTVWLCMKGSEGWSLTANKTLCLPRVWTRDLLSETQSSENSWLGVRSHFGEGGLPPALVEVV